MSLGGRLLRHRIAIGPIHRDAHLGDLLPELNHPFRHPQTQLTLYMSWVQEDRRTTSASLTRDSSDSRRATLGDEGSAGMDTHLLDSRIASTFALITPHLRFQPSITPSVAG